MAPFGTPRRLAGMMLFAPRRCRMCWCWLRSPTPHLPAPPEGSTACRHIEQSRQSTRVAPGPLTGRRCANKICCCTSTTISHFNQGRRGLARGMLLQTAEEEGADGSVGEPRAVDGGWRTRTDRRIAGNRRRLRRRRRRAVSAAIDGTGLSHTSVSTFFLRRLEQHCARASLVVLG